MSIKEAGKKTEFERIELPMFEELTVLEADAPAAKETPLQPGEAHSVFQVDGMDCGECARTVEKVVRKLDGVREASVSFGTSKMTVFHTADLKAITTAVEQVGYQTTLRETTLDDSIVEEAQQASYWERNKRTILTAVSGLFWGLGFVAELAGSEGLLPILLYLVSIVSGGFYVARSGWYALKSLSLDMNFLMSAAAIGAAVIGEWAEGAAVVCLFAIGNWLQSMTMERTRKSIRSLMDIAPKEALIRRTGQEMKLPLKEIRIGDIVIVRPGERLPMDGVVVSGTSSVNQAPITGESVPVEKAAGDDVYAGTINETGSLEYKVTKKVEDTTLSRIIHLVEEAQGQKAPSQQFVDVFAKYYTPAVVLLALLVAVLPPLFTSEGFGVWVYRALVLLVIACPCALVISTPVAIVSAIGNAARQGVLIKGGAYLETLGSIRAIAFDKTGTLTEGKPHVVQIEAAGDRSAEEALDIAAAIEARSEHPLARAILNKQRATGRAQRSAEQFRAVAGKGAEGVVGGTRYRIGKPGWLEELGFPVEALSATIQQEQQQGRTVMLLADAYEILALFSVADIVRKESRETISQLKAAGMAHTVMLTGDNNLTAAAIREETGVDEFGGELLPEDKLQRIQAIKQRYEKVAMVGDGINDAPALAAADIGIAMGGAGTDTALETADLVLMSDDLSKLPFAVRLSRRSLAVIKQNIWFSLAVKAVFLLLTLLGYSNLWMAVFADTGAALIVIANGMRLMRAR